VLAERQHYRARLAERLPEVQRLAALNFALLPRTAQQTQTPPHRQGLQ
jgi:hypothetical protein